MVKEKIIEALKKVLDELGVLGVEPLLEKPTQERHGDFSSNVALTAFGKVSKEGKVPNVSKGEWKTPLELAQEISKNFKFQISNFKFLDKVEVVAPGFINFFLSQNYLVDQLQRFTSASHPSSLAPHPGPLPQRGEGKLVGKHIMVEFTDPNPFKEFHIGHLYSNIVGEAISRLLESQGGEVWRVTYQGDVGLHVAKAIYGMLRKVEKVEEVEKESVEKRAKFLGDAYALGSRAYEDSAEQNSAKEEIIEINKKVYQGDPLIREVYEKGRAWSLEHFEQIYKRLGSEFKKNYFESVAGPIGSQLVKEHIKDGIFTESEGAIIFEGKKHGLHNRVFINSLGLPTYEAKDMGLPSIKFKDYQYDKSIIITAQEQSAYFTVVLKALSFVNPDLAAKTIHIAHGVVRLPEGKMSSRTGNVLTGEWLLDSAKQKVEGSYKDMEEKVAEQVAIAAVKYALLKQGIGKDIEFDFEESISLEGNSGPYLQYTFARTRSVLAKIKNHPFGKLRAKIKDTDQKSKIQNLEPEELSLLRVLNQFSQVVEEASDKLAPNMVANYLFDLAQKFNLFYQRHKILPKETDGTTEFRLALTEAVGNVLKNGLYLLGISAPERM